MDLQQRRREERAPEKRGRGSLREDIGTVPYLLIGRGFVLGALASWFAVVLFDKYTSLVTLLVIILILLAGLGV